LRELLSTKQAWLWGPEQKQVFDRVKPGGVVIATDDSMLYNPLVELKVSADAQVNV